VELEAWNKFREVQVVKVECQEISSLHPSTNVSQDLSLQLLPQAKGYIGADMVLTLRQSRFGSGNAFVFQRVLLADWRACRRY
jgi:hypothetical protein